MTSLAMGYSGLVCLLVLLIFRVPIGVALGLVSFFGIAAMTSMNAAWGILSAVPFNFIGDWSLSAIPMFLLMGFVTAGTGLTNGLFRAMSILFRSVPGGLAIATVGACTLFAAATGASIAAAAAMSRIAIPEMLRYRYDIGLASGAVAMAGTLGALIPPSILMVIYGIFAKVSIAQLFMAGFLPGLLSALVFALLIVVRVKLKPSLAPSLDIKFTPEDFQAALYDIWPLPVLVFCVIGGIFAGIFTPTEAGAIGAGCAVLLALVRRQLTISGLKVAVVETVMSSSSIFVIGIGAVLFTRFMALSGVPDSLASVILSNSETQLGMILQVSIIYIFLGMFIDSIGILLLTLPILIPVAQAADMNLIWFGVILVKLLEIGLVTPPVGLNVFVIKGALGSDVSLTQIFKGVTWFVVADIFTLSILVMFPIISLYIPSIM